MKILRLLCTMAALVIIALIAQSCKSKKQAVSSGESVPEAVVEQLPAAPPYQSLTAKLEVGFPRVSATLKCTLKMVPDSALMLSIQPIFGIEMARILCTTDSVYVIDKYRRKTFVKSYKDIYRHGSINLQLIQGLLCNLTWGTDPENEANVSRVSRDGGGTIISVSDAPVYSSFELDSEGSLLRSSVKNDEAGLKLTADYSGFARAAEGFDYPMTASYDFASPSLNYSAEVTTTSLTLNKAKNIGISLPASYQKASLDEIMNLLP